MKTMVEIPEDLLQEAFRHTGARSEQEAVVTAVTEFNRHRRLAELVERFGTFEHFISHEELRRFRESD